MDVPRSYANRIFRWLSSADVPKIYRAEYTPLTNEELIAMHPYMADWPRDRQGNIVATAGGGEAVKRVIELMNNIWQNNGAISLEGMLIALAGAGVNLTMTVLDYLM